MSTPEVKLRGIIGSEETTNFFRFPKALGSESSDPESKKFCSFQFRYKGDNNTSKLRSVIVLPHPEINDAINVKYDTSQMDATGAVGVGSMSGNLDYWGLERILKTGVQSFSRDNFARIAADVALSATPGLKAGVAKGLNTIQNPYMTNVFNSSGFREFAFQFTLIPKSDTESQYIQQIIKAFKFSMLPQKDDDGSFGMALLNGKPVSIKNSTGIIKMPDKVDIDFFPMIDKRVPTGAGKNLKIKNAVITNVGIEYSAGTPTPIFYSDNNPFSVTINISVKETEIYTKERCEMDYGPYISNRNKTSSGKFGGDADELSGLSGSLVGAELEATDDIGRF